MAALLAAVTLGAAASSAQADAPGLRVDGNRLVRITDGSAFQVRGVNWPSFEYACAYDYAYSTTWDAPAIAAIASWKVNTVRVPLNEDCWLGRDGASSKEGRTPAGYRAAVQAFVSALHDHGLVAILDLHWAAPDGTLATGQRAMPNARSVDFWSSVAGTFKGDRAVLFDVYNEPYSRYDGDALTFDLTWTCWRDGGCAAPLQNDQTAPYDGKTYAAVGMQALVDAVRGAGAPQPILLAGRDYANDLGGWLAHRPADGGPGTADDQLAASLHTYPGQACSTVACWDATVAPVAAQVPVVTTEINQTDCKADHVQRLLEWADARGVGYAVWAWWVRDDDPSCGSYAIVADAGGTPRGAVGSLYRSHLLARAQAGGGAGAGGSGAGAGGGGTGGAGTTGGGDGVTTDASGETGGGPAGTSPAGPQDTTTTTRRTAALRLSATRLRDGVARGGGVLHPAATGTVVVRVRHRAGRAGRVRLKVARVRVRAGRFRFAVRLPARARLVSVSVTYADSAAVLPARAVRRS